MLLSDVFYGCARAFLNAFLRCFCRLRIIGKKRLPSCGPVIICPNHVSVLDPLLMLIILDRKAVFLAADYLFDIPVVGWVLNWGGAIRVQGLRTSLRAVRQTLEILREGGQVVIFPQGGVREPDAPVEVNPGASLLALRSDAPLVPVYIHGSREVLPVGRYWPRPGSVSVIFGRPLNPGDGESGAERITRLSGNLAWRMRDLQKRATKFGGN